MTDVWTTKKKVLTRKERFRITEEHAKKKEKEENMEKLLLQKEDQAEKLQLDEKVQKDRADMEHEIRSLRLPSSCEKFSKLRESIVRQRLQSRDVKTLNEYPEIKNLKRIVAWANERISQWRNEKIAPNGEITEIHARLRLLNTLTAYTENPLGIGRAENWYECRREVRNHLYETLDRFSYDVIKDVERNMFYANANAAADVLYHKECDERFTHTLWTVLDRARTGKGDKFPLVCNFEECAVTVNLPKSFLSKRFAVRCLVMSEDYFSADCRSYRTVELPRNVGCDFCEYHRKLRKRHEELRKQQAEEESRVEEERQRRLSMLNKIKHLIPVVSNGDGTADGRPSLGDADAAAAEVDSAKTRPKDLQYLSKFINLKKSYSRLLLDEEKSEVLRVKRDLTVQVDACECNMRKFNIVGGVYHLDLVKQPPQPKQLKDGSILRTIIGKDGLQRWHYVETYEPQTVKTGLTKQSTDDDDDDADNTPEGTLLSKIILIIIKLPDHVLWFDTPMPVLWNFENDYWSTDYIYDTKFNEEKQTISFRAGKMGPFGLAVFKYNNFPFQSWELKSNETVSNEVIFGLTTSNLILEFIVRRNEICLATLENASTSALQQLVGEFYEPATLVRLLKTGGVNIFPDDDACVYVDGAQMKHRPTENYLYFCMASLCLHYQFSWSRWNLMADYKKFVMQTRKRGVSKGSTLLLVTDQRAIMADGTDIQSLSDIEASEKTFYPDLLTLLANNSEDEIGAEIIAEAADEEFVGTVYFILSHVRVLSFS